ncbi:hypothetical protein B296_00014315 [Ensete ventricosum]|uniref:Uncharacterized protein n=1 Tax=Ensete ventricosum TaxID=4639 RepID=A0A427AXZ6_ENSVE|nr:hypothetical protein B296_00014315 [Ensete ventricosum]
MAYPTAASVAILISCIIVFLLLCYPLLWSCVEPEALGRIAKQEKLQEMRIATVAYVVWEDIEAFIEVILL